MYIVMIASEMAPIAKVGGLGDVVYGLAKELSKNHDVEIILPKYACVDYSALNHLKVDCHEVWPADNKQRYKSTIWTGKYENLNCILVEAHHPKKYFTGKTIYGGADEEDRFAYFSKAALDYLFKAEKKPDILHLHDWHTAIAAPLYKETYVPLGLEIRGVVLTIHNFEYQGKCLPTVATRFGLKQNEIVPMHDPVDAKLINLLKGGIEYADYITTVSPTYEKEVKTPLGGHDLNLTLLKYQHKLKGILNGIDESYWNPEKDPHLFKRFATHNIDSQEKLLNVLEAKAENRKHLRSQLKLAQRDVPIVSAVTRLTPQKGPSLIKYALKSTLEQGAQFVLLGSTHDPAVEKEFLALKKECDPKNAAIHLIKDESLAHLIYAGADMIVIPSIFEPCGLTQMISMRYGTIPIVRMTGGLADTVFDIDTSHRPYPQRNGFTFDFADKQGIDWSLNRALKYWVTDQKKWHDMMLSGMRRDLSWGHAAKQYIEIYTKLSSRKVEPLVQQTPASELGEAKEKKHHLSFEGYELA